MAIYSNGLVGPCCNLVEENTNWKYQYNSITEIWNGEKMTELRNGFKNNNPNDVCNHAESQELNLN